MTIDLQTICQLEWRAFEELCALIFQAQNKHNVSLNSFGADGGADFTVNHKVTGNILAAAQCKAYSKKQIGVNLIRELLGTMQDLDTDRGFFFTTSKYTIAAHKLAERHSIELLDSSDILKSFSKLEDDQQKKISDKIFSSDYSIPTCINCGIKLVEKRNKLGKLFWGCKNFPRCRITMKSKSIHNKTRTPKNSTKPSTLKKLLIYIFRIFILFLFIALLFSLTTKIAPQLTTPLLNLIGSEPKTATNNQQVTPETRGDNQNNFKNENTKFLYLMKFTNGTQVVVDHVGIKDEMINYKKGSLNVSIHTNDVQDIQRIRVRQPTPPNTND